MGGVNKGAWCYGDIWESGDGGVSWSPVPASSNPRWHDRSGHAAVVLDEPRSSPRVVLLGGVGKDRMFNDVWESHDGGESWTQRTSKAGWCPRYGHRAVPISGGAVVLTGGVTMGGLLADVWQSLDGGTSWAPAAMRTPPWQARAAHAVVRLSTPGGEALVLLAGKGEDGVLRDVWRSMDCGASWHCVVERAPWLARCGPAAVPLAGNVILLLGGYTGQTYLADVWTSGDLGSSWTLVRGAAPWLPRYCHACIALGGQSIMVLGGHAADNSLSDVWESPSRALLRRHTLLALLVGRRLETSRGISRELWRGRVMPYLLPRVVL